MSGLMDFCAQEALEMVKFQLRHGNDLLAMDCIRKSDVSTYFYCVAFCLSVISYQC